MNILNHNKQRIGTLRDNTFQYDPYWVEKGFSISPVIAPLNNNATPYQDFLLSKSKRELHKFKNLPPFLEQTLGGGYAESIDDLLLMKTDVLSSGDLKCNTFQQNHQISLNLLKNHVIEQKHTATTRYFCNKLHGEEMKATGFLNQDTLYSHPVENSIPVLIKFNPPKSEKIYYEQANKLNINTPGIINSSHPELLITARYDFDSNHNKKHVQSFASILGVDYQNNLADTIHLFSTLKDISNRQNIFELYRRITFNQIYGVGDDHLKNFELIYSQEQNIWELSPIFDINQKIESTRILPLYGHNSIKPNIKGLTELGIKYQINNFGEIINKTIESIHSINDYTTKTNLLKLNNIE